MKKFIRTFNPFAGLTEYLIGLTSVFVGAGLIALISMIQYMLDFQVFTPTIGQALAFGVLMLYYGLISIRISAMEDRDETVEMVLRFASNFILASGFGLVYGFTVINLIMFGTLSSVVVTGFIVAEHKLSKRRKNND